MESLSLIEPCGAGEPPCNGVMQRAPRGPGANAWERIDTGLLGKPVQRLAEAPRLHRERDPKDPVH